MVVPRNNHNHSSDWQGHFLSWRGQLESRKSGQKRKEAKSTVSAIWPQTKTFNGASFLPLPPWMLIINLFIFSPNFLSGNIWLGRFDVTTATAANAKLKWDHSMMLLINTFCIPHDLPDIRKSWTSLHKFSSKYSILSLGWDNFAKTLNKILPPNTLLGGK